MRRIRTLRAAVLALPLLFVGVLVGLMVVPGHAADEDRLAYSATWYVVLDPAWTRYPNDERMLLALYDCLTARDPATGKIVPAAATHWETSTDGLRWTFHLDPKAVWSDGSPVKASDFAAAWQRAVDPYESSVHAALFRPLKGCAAIADGDRAMRAFSGAAKGIEELLKENPDGIPGKELRTLVEQSGVRPLAESLDDAAVKRLLKWGTDKFPADKAKAAQKAFKSARRKVKGTVYDSFEAFGKNVGVQVVDDHTLVVPLERPCPWLPQLLARPLFAPLHPKTVKGGEHAFAPDSFQANGAYTLKGRGPKPRGGLPNPETLVHLIRNDRYAGSRPGKMPEIFCFTGQGPAEDLRRLKNGELQWMADAAPATRKEAASQKGYVTRPAGRLVMLRLRADRPPFDRLEVRRALALGIDRSRLTRLLWPTPKEAWRVVPPDVAGPGSAPSAPKVDVKAAKKLLKEAGLAGSKFPWVELHYEDRTGSGLDDIADALLQQWEKGLGIEMGLRIDEPRVAQQIRAAGAFQLALGHYEGAASDPAAWMLPLGAGHPDSGLGWDDPPFEALLAAATDVDGLLKGGEDALSKLPDAASLRPKVEAARRGAAKEKDALRRALIRAAEARALDACIVIPLLWPEQASVEKQVQGLGGTAAWKHPTFYGSLRTATRVR